MTTGEQTITVTCVDLETLKCPHIDIVLVVVFLSLGVRDVIVVMVMQSTIGRYVYRRCTAMSRNPIRHRPAHSRVIRATARPTWVVRHQ